MLKRIAKGEVVYAIVVPSTFKKEGVEFFTPQHFSQQLGYMNHKAGYEIPAHDHEIHLRKIEFTQEVLIIRSGKIVAHIFDENRTHIEDITLTSGDVILLCAGGHGFSIIEDTEMIEVKQGPYMGDVDKNIYEA